MTAWYVDAGIKPPSLSVFCSIDSASSSLPFSTNETIDRDEVEDDDFCVLSV